MKRTGLVKAFMGKKEKKKFNKLCLTLVMYANCILKLSGIVFKNKRKSLCLRKTPTQFKHTNEARNRGAFFSLNCPRNSLVQAT